jgi:hypothetical protein
MFANHKTPLLVALAGCLVSSTASAYPTQSECEDFEGPGKCEQCSDGSWHRAPACGLIATLQDDPAAVAEATELVELFSYESDHYAVAVEVAAAEVIDAAATNTGLDAAILALSAALAAAGDARDRLADAVAWARDAIDNVDVCE